MSMDWLLKWLHRKEVDASHELWQGKNNFYSSRRSGSLETVYQLGLLYSNSNYDGYNKETATRYFLKAANNNHVDAMYQTGMMYLGSDNAAAKIWLRKASERGHA